MPKDPDHNLYQRGGIFYARTQVRGQELRESLHTAHRPEARRRRDRWLEQVNQQAYGEERHRWQDAAGKYATEVAPGNIKASTAARYTVSIGQLHEFLGDRFVDEIDSKLLADIIGKRKAAGATNATIRRDLTAVSVILSACKVWGWCGSNPAREFDRTMIRERREPIKPPSDEDIAKLIKICPENFGRCVTFLRQTGMRQQEAVMLEWPQIDLRRRTAQLTTTKASRARAVPLSRQAVGTLAGTPRHNASDFVFWHGEGLPYRNFASRFAALATRAEVDFRCHDLRHKYAIEFLRGGGDIYKLSKILGHTSVKTTEIYLGYVA